MTIAAQGILLGRPVSHSIKEDWMKAWKWKMNIFDSGDDVDKSDDDAVNLDFESFFLNVI